jgi:N-acyl-D-aspartate/D-glutamate deacylase
MKYTQVLACPDASAVGRSFDEIGAARGVDPVDAFLDLVASTARRCAGTPSWPTTAWGRCGPS